MFHNSNMPAAKGQWKSAVDPKSGKEYYYHTVTRETQWRKPMELASDKEQRKMIEKEAKQKDFFASMEANILNSLSQGVVPGTNNESEVQRLASRKLSKRGERPELERTISSMDETMFRDLIRRQPSIHQPKQVETIQSTVSSLGGFESIIRQPSRLASVSEMFNNIPDEESIHSEDHADFDGHASGRSDAGAFNMSAGSGFGLSWEETAALKKLGAIAKEMKDSEDDKNSDLPQEIALFDKDVSKMDPMPTKNVRSQSDGGPMFQKAKNIGGRELDFDPSDSDDDDDDDDNDDGPAVRPAVQRRNTCGTMYVKTTMSAPDVDATIKCICGVFRSHILTSELVDPETDNEYEVFNDVRDCNGPSLKPPSLDEVTKFYRDIFLKAQMESDTMIMSLIYVEQLIKKTQGALRPRAGNWRSLIFSCMILSSKVWDDLSMWNVDFSQSCPKGVSFTLQRINDLEINILKAMSFQVKVPASEYAKYYFLLRSMLIKSGLGGEDMSNPLDVEGARRLQQMSSQFEYLSMAKEKTRSSFDKGNRAQSLNPNLLGDTTAERKTLPKMGLEHVVEIVALAPQLVNLLVMMLGRCVTRSASRCSSSAYLISRTSPIPIRTNHFRGYFSGFHTTAPRQLMSTEDNSSSSVGSRKTESQEVLEQCSRLYDSLTGLNDRLGGVAISSPTDRGTKLPYVLLVGNHSSGKSSFINYVLQRNIQTAGVAPTDDTFTVIAPGPEDKDSDGPTLVGDPDMGFASLRQFGPTLIHHTQFKQRDSHLDFMLVDSPGMIDAPVNKMRKGASANVMDRGYDFPGVVRWLAQRADIVMLFFDPDKPGTTGETMDVLLNCLSGMDHKLLIVLNKADQFHKIHDFARAYGSLCWNLSKVIPRKDLPPIFTMSLPNDQNLTSTLSESLKDLEQTRDDVVEQVMRAPKRRIDNVITNLYDSTSMLLLYSKIWNDVVSRFVREWRRCRLQEAGWTVVGGAAFGGVNHLAMDPMLQGGVLGGSIFSIGALFWYHQTYLQRMQEDLTTFESLSTSFQRTHTRQVHDGDEFAASMFQRVRKPMQNSLQNEFANSRSLPSVNESELQRLQSILDSEIPKLRRLANEAR